MTSISPAFQYFILAYSSLVLTIFYAGYNAYQATGEPAWFSSTTKAIIAVLAAPLFLALAMCLTLLRKPVILVLNKVVLPLLKRRLQRKQAALIKARMKL